MRHIELQLRPGQNWREQLSRILQVDHEQILNARLLRRSLDARSRRGVRVQVQIGYQLSGDPDLPPQGPEHTHTWQWLTRRSANHQRRPTCIVGAGPAGLFCALSLALAGTPVQIIERGDPVEQRQQAVRRFWETGELDPESNVQFGEGGAGTFSDGKLTTRVKSPDRDYVLQCLLRCSAPEHILWDAKPHIGTDRLHAVLIAMRHWLRELGVRIDFRTRLDDIQARPGGGLHLNTTAGTLEADRLVLAIGNSARELFATLGARLQAQPKPFALGMRIEHERAMIDRTQFGADAPLLEAADYRLSADCGGRGIYSFCMCPGGQVINASSQPGMLAVNGMSLEARDGRFSNSAIVLQVGPEDVGSEHFLAGMHYQQTIERRAFELGQAHAPPAMRVQDFIRGQISTRVPPTSVPGGVQPADLRRLLRPELNDALIDALGQFGRRIRHFDRDGVLIGAETRTSSPLRLPRDPATGASIAADNIFPCGEGAGYAGGIMSAALDGVRVARHILDS